MLCEIPRQKPKYWCSSNYNYDKLTTENYLRKTYVLVQLKLNHGRIGTQKLLSNCLSTNVTKRTGMQYCVQDFFGRCRFFDKHSNKKNRCAPWNSMERGVRQGVRGLRVQWRSNSSLVESRSKASENFGYFSFCLNSSKHRSCGSVTTSSDDLSIVFLVGRGGERGYTSLKIALGMILAWANT